MEKNLKLGSLFDGSGGFPLAGSLCGITPAWASEVEPYPIAVTRSRFPQMRHLGSVTEVNGGEVEPVDIVTFGSPCFPAGTLVLTSKGYAPIEDIRLGDLVFTHKGNWKPVSAIGHKYSPTLKLSGHHYGVITTPNHPFYSAEQGKSWNGNGYDRTLEHVGEWTPAEDMQGKRWAVPNEISGLPIPRVEKQSPRQNDPPEVNADLMYIIGRWLGDGWLRNGQRPGRPTGDTWGQIYICANTKKAPYLEERLHLVFEGSSTVHRISDRTVEKFRVYNQALCRWIKKHFGSHAYGKKIPAWAYCMSWEMREALLQGYIDSDGYRFKENTWKATTVSKKLAHGIRLLAETLGFSCTVHYAAVGETTMIEGRTVNQRPQYQVVLSKERHATAMRRGTHTWYHCKKVEPYSSNQMVYNITVDDDHSYIVEGFVVHNCQDLSVAGKRAGLKHEANGDEETTRSGLFMEAVRIIKEMREKTDGVYPRFAVWENVPGAFSSNKGEDFRTVLEELIKIVEPTAAMPAVPPAGWPYADVYCGDGWSLAYRVLCAQYWGVPQRRRRIYLVLDLRGQRAGEVLFEREGLRGYFAEGGSPWQGSAGDAEGGAGAADRPCLLKIRSECEGGGKGPLVQENKSATLSCNNDQYLFQPVTLEPGIAAREGGHIYEGVSGTLRANAGDNQMAVANAVNTPILDDQGGAQISVRTDDKAPTLRAETHGNLPCVLEAAGLDGYNSTLTGGVEATLGVNCGMSTGRNGVVVDAGFCPEMGAKARDIGYEAEKGPTLRAGAVPGVCTQVYDARGNGDGATVPTLTGDHENRITDYTSVVCAAHGQANAEVSVDRSPCLNCNHEQPIVFDKEVYNSGVGATGGAYIAERGPAPTLRGTGHPPGVCTRYIVRRLTPTECARLQGFPDRWGHPDRKEELTDEEYAFWTTVRATFEAINGREPKTYRREQMLTWYNKLHTDSAEYKMWGNGIALPTALYVMQGIRDAMQAYIEEGR